MKYVRTIFGKSIRDSEKLKESEVVEDLMMHRFYLKGFSLARLVFALLHFEICPK